VLDVAERAVGMDAGPDRGAARRAHARPQALSAPAPSPASRTTGEASSTRAE
jgi:hypothetical protein